MKSKRNRQKTSSSSGRRKKVVRSKIVSHSSHWKKKKVLRSKKVSRSSRPEPFLSTPGRYFHNEGYFLKDIPTFQLIPAFRKIGLTHSGTQGYAFCFQPSSFSALFRFSINSCYQFDVGGIPKELELAPGLYRPPQTLCFV